MFLIAIATSGLAALLLFACAAIAGTSEPPSPITPEAGRGIAVSPVA